MKCDWKFKLDYVLEYKEGRRGFASVGIDRKSFLSNVRTWVKSYDGLGIDGLKRPQANKV